MLIKTLQSYLDKSQIINQCRQKIAQNSDKTLFYGLSRSAKSLFLADCFYQSKKDVIFVCADDKIAEDFYEDIKLITSEETVKFLPDYEVLAYEERSPHYMIRAQRLQTLTSVSFGKSCVYIVSFRSFLRYVANLETLAKNCKTLRMGEETDMQLLVSDLVSNGYNHEFQVTKIGEFARRGGIFDIYAPNHKYPLRIEFFGDEIVSMHYFDIQTQRSYGASLEETVIIPMREFSLHDVTTEHDYFWQKIHEKGFYDGIELNIPLLLKEKATFIEYFKPEKCLLFWDEFQFIPSMHLEILEETTELWRQASQKKRIGILSKPQELVPDEIYLHNVVKKYQNYFLSNSFQEFAQIQFSLEIKTHNHHNLYGNLELLENELTKKINQKYLIIIQSDNASQRKRMRDLLTAFEEQVHFTIGVLQNGFSIEDAKIAIFTDHEIFSRYRSRSKSSSFSKKEALVDYEDLKPGDYIVHIDHGIGVFEGLKKIAVTGKEIECLVLAYANNDKIYVPTFQLTLVSKYISEEGISPVIHKLGGKKWEQTKSRAKQQIELIAQDLLDLYAERRIRKGIEFAKDTKWQKEMEDSFIYEETDDQLTSTEEIKKDMESDAPMERLLCGDVGFGKTEVAIRAAFKAVMSGWQVAILVPTTLLAEQHYLVFRERLAEYPVNIAMFSRFRTQANINKDLVRLGSGEVDIAIGTHRLLSKDVKFKKLGFLIIDEEHRFGVRHKDKLRTLKSNVDTLYMSATPIPRTLYMALSKLKEMSLIQTSPKARLPIRTVIVPFDLVVIKDAILREIDRGGQVYFIHNRVKTIESIADSLRKTMPNVRFRVGHGQLPEKQLEQVMLDFADQKFDVLIATTIIESGIDIPNVNTIIINRADMFGLAQLYQMRGRVGRSNRRAYAYLTIPNQLTDIARKRLETLVEYESLGSGYQIAMRDMELRGVGMLLGIKQSGIINTVGFHYYNRLLETATKNMMNKKEIWGEEDTSTKELFTDINSFFPEDYIPNEKERLRIYKRLLHLHKEEDFDEIGEELNDRFGKMPIEAEQAIHFYKLKFLLEKTKMTRLLMKRDAIHFEFKKENPPSRELISNLLQQHSYPVKFETVDSFKIIFQIHNKTSLDMVKIAESATSVFIH